MEPICRQDDALPVATPLVVSTDDGRLKLTDPQLLCGSRAFVGVIGLQKTGKSTLCSTLLHIKYRTLHCYFPPGTQRSTTTRMQVLTPEARRTLSSDTSFGWEPLVAEGFDHSLAMLLSMVAEVVVFTTTDSDTLDDLATYAAVFRTGLELARKFGKCPVTRQVFVQVPSRYLRTQPTLKHYDLEHAMARGRPRLGEDIETIPFAVPTLDEGTCDAVGARDLPFLPRFVEAVKSGLVDRFRFGGAGLRAWTKFDGIDTTLIATHAYQQDESPVSRPWRNLLLEPPAGAFAALTIGQDQRRTKEPATFVRPPLAPTNRWAQWTDDLRRYLATGMCGASWKAGGPLSGPQVARVRAELSRVTYDAGDAERDGLIRVAMLGLADLLADSGVELAVSDDGHSDLRLLTSLPCSALCVRAHFRTLFGKDFAQFTADPESWAQADLYCGRSIADALGVSNEEVVITRAIEGSTIIEGIIGRAFIGNRISQDDLQTLDEIYKKLRDEFKKNFPGEFLDLEVTARPIATRFSLSPSDFDRRGDFKFPCAAGDKQKRGGHAYLQPNSQWRRLGLRVLDLYDDNGWLDMNGSPKEWMVGFHGTGGNPGASATESATGFKKISTTRVLVPGWNNAWGGRKALNQSTRVPNQGIYFANNVDKCFWWRTTGPDGQEYGLALQCRIDPRYAWIPKKCQSFIVVDSPLHVRPYGILVKKIGE